MSVAQHLGLDDPESEVLALARERWSGWQRSHPQLRVVEELSDLPGWLRVADWESADRVLLVLAQLSAADGGDDVAATGVLAWVLLPGASGVAYRLRRLSSTIDELVAAQLWVEARTFPWRRGHKVAANIVMNSRRGVLRDLGIADPHWSRIVPFASGGVPGAGSGWFAPLWAEDWIEPVDTAEDILAEVFEVATSRGVLSQDDQDLLLSLAYAADQVGPTRSGRGHGGLSARAVTEVVAVQRGMSPRGVRRRASRSVAALRTMCGTSDRISA